MAEKKAKAATAKEKAERREAMKHDELSGKTLSSARGTGHTDESLEGFDEGDGPVREQGVDKYTTVSEGTAAPSPPGWEFGDHWNSDDARKAYEVEGTTLEKESTKGAEGEPPGSARPPASERE